MLRDYVQRWNPYIVFLIETKENVKHMERVEYKLGFSNGLLFLVKAIVVALHSFGLKRLGWRFNHTHPTTLMEQFRSSKTTIPGDSRGSTATLKLI